MVRKIADLRTTSDEDLIAEHDAAAPNTHVGTGYYMEELNRRAAERAADATNELSRRVYILTWANCAVAVVAAIAAIIALFA